MIITIHRGINQIGGCITEIASASGTKILIDLGHNLPDGDDPSEDKYDNSANLSALLDGVKAVFYTHPHGDHGKKRYRSVHRPSQQGSYAASQGTFGL